MSGFFSDWDPADVAAGFAELLPGFSSQTDPAFHAAMAHWNPSMGLASRVWAIYRSDKAAGADTGVVRRIDAYAPATGRGARAPAPDGADPFLAVVADYEAAGMSKRAAFSKAAASHPESLAEFQRKPD